MWTVAYDTMYSMVDREDDLKIGVKSALLIYFLLPEIFRYYIKPQAVGCFNDTRI